MPSSRPAKPPVHVGRCTARTALAGNPSDGYGGAVVSIPVRSVSATVEWTASTRFELCPSPTDDDTFDDLGALVEHVDRVGYGDARQLVAATLRSLRRHCDADIEPARVSASSTIPRSVGLAGSSAIIIATIRAAVEAHRSTPWAAALSAKPSLLAAIALDVEQRELQIAAGLQDRVVQAYGAPMYMDFASPTSIGSGALTSGEYRQLAEPPGAVFVAALDDAAGSSGVTHHSLRQEFDADIGDTRRLMGEIALQAEAAATAIDRGDIDSLGSAMDATLDLRQSMMVLDPRPLAMAEIARSHGCHVNWSGSGGAIAVLAAHEALAATTQRALVAELGCTIIEV